MPLVRTEDLRQGELRPDTLQVYCGLDCCLTLEVFQEIASSLIATPLAYTFERALQGPVLEIMLRGFKVNEFERRCSLKALQLKLERLTNILNQYAFAIWGKGLNPRSPKQLLSFFYEAMRLPEVWTSKKGIRRLSTDREALEKLEVYFHARPLVSCILSIREVGKKISVLETEIDHDGRMRTSYNIAGTETGRFSSSGNVEGRGTNLQNITPELRRIFVADEGWKLGVIDLEQAESREVGWLCFTLFNDPTYLDAAESGDLHTLTAKLIWPKIKDRAMADASCYRHFSYRDMSKRGGHGSNYLGTPWTMSRHLKVPLKLMEDFQHKYFTAFPAIPQWHRWVAQELQTKQYLETPFGFKRHFFGRPNDETTLREAIAFGPQSSTAYRTNLGLYRHWMDFKKTTRLLAQTHDSITFLYREEEELEVLPKALALMEVTLVAKGRTFTIPGEAKVGWNWGSYDKGRNPNGLLKWKGGKDGRARLGGLDQPVPSLQ